MIQVIKKDPGKPPEVINVEPDADGEVPYAFMSEAVGGYFDTVLLASDERGLGFGRTVTAWVDDEGLLKHRPFNVTLVRADGAGIPIVGPILVTATEGPESVGLTAEEVAHWMGILGGKDQPFQYPLFG